MQTKNDSVLILDDEPQHQQWLVEFVESKGLRVETVTSLPDAEGCIRSCRYRFVVIDLNVPARTSSQLDPIAKHYPGLVAARLARNLGYRDRQVVVYSVHDSDEVRRETNRIGVRYVLKGRPKEFKEEVVSILQFDPTAKTTPAKNAPASPAARARTPLLRGRSSGVR